MQIEKVLLKSLPVSQLNATSSGSSNCSYLSTKATVNVKDQSLPRAAVLQFSYPLTI